jgi:NADH-quinone oxidoreductase subunit A
MIRDYLPILIQFIVVFGFVGGTIFLTHLLGPKRHSKQKDEAFECGIESVGDARVPFSVHYFLIAILFVLFDVEIVFFYPWAVNFYTLGWSGLLQIVLFVVPLFIALAYLNHHKIFDFEQEKLNS